MFILDENNIPEAIEGLKDVFDIKEKRIAELEKENELLKSDNDVLKGVDPDWVPRDWLDSLREKYDRVMKENREISELNEKQGEAIIRRISENDELKKENKDLEELNEKQYYTIGSLSDKNDKLEAEMSEINLKHGGIIAKQDKMIETLRTKNDKLEAENKELKDIIAKNTARHNEMLFEKDRLVNKLHEYESQIAEMAEKATNPDYVKFLEHAKKFSESNMGMLAELEEAAHPENNVTIIENQYNDYRCDCPFCNKNDDI